jgi:peroxiredoxin
MQKKPKWAVILIFSAVGLCLLICAGAGLAIHFAPDIYDYSLKNSSLEVGQAAPDFELADLDGGTVRLTEFRGRPVVISIGASWCPDCRVEAPLLQEAHERHPGLVVLLIDTKESRAVAQGFADEFGLTHPVLLDTDGAVSELYRVFAIPTELFIDADGVVRAKLIESVTPELLAENLALIGVEP